MKAKLIPTNLGYFFFLFLVCWFQYNNNNDNHQASSLSFRSPHVKVSRKRVALVLSLQPSLTKSI
jgi:hypothetical protein